MIDLDGITLIVTGFPRSGTSMMMRILRNAGIEVIADDHTNEPQHKYSPYGSGELENVGTSMLAMDKSETANKAIKIVCPYASAIPIDRPVKAIFMQRDLTEIITSLFALKIVWDEDIPETIAWTREHLKKNEIPTLFVQYKEAVKYPKTTALGIEEFLEVDLDTENMVNAIDRNARTRYKVDKDLKGFGMPDEIVRVDAEAYKDAEIKVYRLEDVS